ncbi:hypothetical protein BD309DRAFT_969065 [Dichomitus squalens]|nr:hypothetical protein BD309DRAFT_969065 [Dichomitus squalens]
MTRAADTSSPPSGDAASDSPQEPTPKRDEEYWLEDGNIVLIAGETAFRVYRGLLSRQSGVFRDMFAAADPDVDATVEGCPVVHLSDSPEDLRALLQTLVPTERRHVYLPDHKYTFNELEAMARLAHKYQIEDVLEQAISLLKTYYTDQSVKWETYHDPSVLPFSHRDANPIGIVLLARVLEESSMLPVAFYWCAILGNKILDGWKRHDGKTMYLSREDAKAAVAGYGALSRDYGPMLHRIFAATDVQACTSRDKGGCKEAIEWMRARVEALLARAPPQMLNHSWTRNILHFQRLCTACKDELVQRDKVERRKLWCSLPAMFGLSVQGWESV